MTALRKGGAHDSAPQGRCPWQRSAREVPMTALREVEEELSPNLGDKRTATGGPPSPPLGVTSPQLS